MFLTYHFLLLIFLFHFIFTSGMIEIRLPVSELEDQVAYVSQRVTIDLLSFIDVFAPNGIN